MYTEIISSIKILWEIYNNLSDKVKNKTKNNLLKYEFFEEIRYNLKLIEYHLQRNADKIELIKKLEHKTLDKIIKEIHLRKLDKSMFKKGLVYASIIMTDKRFKRYKKYNYIKILINIKRKIVDLKDLPKLYKHNFEQKVRPSVRLKNVLLMYKLLSYQINN